MILGILLLITDALSAASQTEKDALMAIDKSTESYKWKTYANWTHGDPCDNNWHGVSCNSEGSVTVLKLRRNILTGTIPPEIGNLTNLTWLDLSRTHLTGAIPTKIMQLTSLIFLSLMSNSNLYSKDSYVQNFINNITSGDGFLRHGSNYQSILDTNTHN